MNINASIIDQRLTGIQEEIREQARIELNITDSARLKSLAFIYLCICASKSCWTSTWKRPSIV